MLIHIFFFIGRHAILVTRDCDGHSAIADGIAGHCFITRLKVTLIPFVDKSTLLEW